MRWREVRRIAALALYYGFARHLPGRPTPGWQLANALRGLLLRQIFDRCGRDVVAKQGAYFGTGAGIRVGDRSHVGQNSRIDHNVTLGDDVVMGPDVVIMTAAHAFDDPAVPVNQQGALPRRPVTIGNDVWIGTRAVLLPGVCIHDGAVIGAGAIVTRDVAPYAVVGGNPARVVRYRGEKKTTTVHPLAAEVR